MKPQTTVSILLFTLFFGNLLAQQQQAQTPVPTGNTLSFNPSSYVGVQISGSFPFANYKDSGCASPGFNIAVSGGLNTKDKWYGLAYMADFGTNILNVNTFTNILNNSLQAKIHNAAYSSQVTTYDYYGYGGPYAGLYLTFSDGEISFDIKLLGGFMYVQTPDVGVQLLDNGTVVGSAAQASASTIAGSLAVGASLRFKVAQHVGVFAGFDYLYANPQFYVYAVAAVNGTKGPTYAVEGGNVVQAIEVGNAYAGIAYTFSNN